MAQTSRGNPPQPLDTSLTFEAWHAQTAGMAGWARREAIRFVPGRDQDACWDALSRHCQLQHESDWLAEKRLYEQWPPPKRRKPHQGTAQSTSTATGRVQFDTGDPLKQVPAVVYLPAIAGVDVSASGRCRCPMRDHPDAHPSAKAYGTRWYCFSCGAGGSIVDAAAAVYGLEPTGRDFWRLRDLILEALGEPVEGGLHG
jgi:hypothetical protein